jgi:hypothetical protein
MAGSETAETAMEWGIEAVRIAVGTDNRREPWTAPRAGAALVVVIGLAIAAFPIHRREAVVRSVAVVAVQQEPAVRVDRPALAAAAVDVVVAVDAAAVGGAGRHLESAANTRIRKDSK